MHSKCMILLIVVILFNIVLSDEEFDRWTQCEGMNVTHTVACATGWHWRYFCLVMCEEDECYCEESVPW